MLSTNKLRINDGLLVNRLTRRGSKTRLLTNIILEPQEAFMTSIHFVEKIDKYKQVDESSNEWETGNWVVSIEGAAKLVNGDIYLHKGQKEPSYIGGIITGFRIVVRDGKEKVIFRFKRTTEHEGITTATEGWGSEQKRVFT